MNKNLNLLSIALIFLIAGCSKDKQSQPGNSNSNSVKIEIVSGNNQSDTIGRPLPNPMVVKVTQNGTPLSGVYVRFVGSGCNSDNQIEIATKADGTANYQGYLSGDVGQQSVKAYATDANDKNIDSLSFSCTGLEPGPGWHLSGCSIRFGAIPNNFCSLSTGRLLTSYGASVAYLRYSDDYARNWYPVVSAGKHSFQYILSNSSDELFAFSSDAGVQYSADQGKTWANQGATPFENNSFTGAFFSKSGKLLVSTRFSGLFVSGDKGKTWSKTTGMLKQPIGGEIDNDLRTFIEDAAGNFYVVATSIGSLYKSTDEGASWTPITPISTEQVYSFYIDQNNWFYKSRWDANGGIYISKNNGATYSILYNSPNHFMSNMSIQQDGNFYVSVSGAGLYAGAGIAAPFKLVYYDTGEGLFVPYIVANNKDIIEADTETGFTRYYQH